MIGKVCIGVSIILLLPAFIEVFAQVEEQEGNVNGKIEKLQDVIDKCSQTIEIDPDAFDQNKDDCFKFLEVVNSNMTQILRDNRDTIENILYGK